MPTLSKYFHFLDVSHKPHADRYSLVWELATQDMCNSNTINFSSDRRTKIRTPQPEVLVSLGSP